METLLTTIILTISLLTNITVQADNIEVSNILTQSTNDFYLEPNEVALILNNDDYIIINIDTNTAYYNNEKEMDISIKDILGCNATDSEFNDKLITIDNTNYIYNSANDSIITNKGDNNNENNN